MEDKPNFFEKLTMFGEGVGNLFNTVSGGIDNVSESVKNFELPVVKTTVGVDTNTLMYALGGLFFLILVFKRK